MCGGKMRGIVLKKSGLVQHQLENRHDTGPVIEVMEILYVTQKKGSSLFQETERRTITAQSVAMLYNMVDGRA
jgi:hypothetical protein